MATDAVTEPSDDLTRLHYVGVALREAMGGVLFTDLLDFDAVAVDGQLDVSLSPPVPVPNFDFRLPKRLSGEGAPRVALYKSWQEPMTEGWQRWVFDQHEMPYDTLHDADIQAGALSDYDVLIFQAQNARSIERGHAPGSIPPQYAGGLGGAGGSAVQAFVEGGGRVIAIEAATEYVSDMFGLGVSDPEALAAGEEPLAKRR